MSARLVRSSVSWSPLSPACSDTSCTRNSSCAAATSNGVSVVAIEARMPMRSTLIGFGPL